MNTRLKHMTKSTVSVLLSLLMIVSAFTVGIVGTDAAKTTASDPVGAQLTEDDSVSAKTEDDGETVGAKVEDDSEVGATTYYLLLGDNNNNPSGWTKYVSSSSQSFTVTPSSLGLSSFKTGHTYYVGISSSTSYTNMWSQGGSSAIGTKTGSIKEAAAQGFNIGSTSYNFARFQLNSAVDSVKVTTSHSSGATTYNFSTGTSTWTVVGNSTELFGTAWDYTATANDMTGSGTSYTWSKSNVSLTAGTISYQVAKNHASTTVYPSTAATQTVSSTGVYDVTVTYNDSTHAVNMTLTDRTPHTLTVGSPGNAVLTAAYNGTTANEGGTLSVPAGSTVNVYVTPDTGYKLDTITSTAGGATSVSGNKGTLTMPAADTTLNITLTDAGKKTIYFNNMNTLYAMVSAKYTYNGTTTSNTMTRLSNSNIWSIEIPADLEYITFVGDNGNNTGSMSIPWGTYTVPKYTAPTNKTAPTIANGGRWGEYTARANEVIVTNGSSITNGINNGTLFAGITATMYDYYADGEVSSGATNWLTGINTTANSKEYTTDKNDWKWNSFTKLNSALSDYASTHSVAYPLYFGNLNVWSDNGTGNAIGNVGHSNKSTITSYTNWNQIANGSIQLSNGSNAVTGLSGKTLANSNIHYYSSSDSTNENGAIMAMFDEDFLSGENNQNAALATILRSSFPVRIETRGATTTYPNKIYVQCNGSDGTADWDKDSAQIWVRFIDSSSNGLGDYNITSKDSNGYHSATIPSGTAKISLVRMPSNYSGTTIDYDKKWNKQSDIAVTTDTTSANRLYKITAFDGDPTRADIPSSYGTTSGGYKYYQFNSDGGKDNAYVESITKPTSSATGSATLEYYENSNKVYSAEYGKDKKAAGFFPFDKNNFINRVDKHAHDLGFGMKLEIPFTLNANGVLDDGTTAQTFDFSGDDDLWVFIDNKLVLDLGGEHTKTTGSINFKDCSVTANKKEAIGSATRNGKFGTDVEGGWFDNRNPNTVHTMTIYYMERGMFDSNLMFGFSFHAIPNQLKTEKKVRTANINSGFYVLNDTTRSDTTVDDGARYVTWFEKSYQYEHFNIVQKSDTKPTDKEGTGKVTYSLRGATNYSTYGTAAQYYAINYNLNNDNIAYFLDQYKSGTNITLTESTAGNSNRYNYDQSVVVYDDANNGAVVTGTGDISTGYTFEFGQTVHTDLDNLNLRARITNQMKSHNLTVTKTLNDPDDTTSEFTLQFLFNFDMAAVAGINTATTVGYHAYPLYVKVNGTETQLNADGTITIKPGDILELIKIPENAQMQILETIPADSKYGYGSTTVTNGTDVTTVANGVQFKMGTTDSTAVIHNVKGSLQITHQLHPDSTAIGSTLVSAKVKDGSTDIATYAETSDEDGISIDPQYIKRDSTYNLEIVLRSDVVDTISYFEDFYEQITGTMNTLTASGTPYTAVIDKASRTATITVPISGLFTSGTQTYTLLPFYSKFITSVYKYKLHFDFQGYRDLYGYLGYDYSEQTFTMAELDDYFEISDDVVDTNKNRVTAPVFKDDDARQSFINLKAPYENTFMETVKWQTDMYDADSHPEGMTATYNSGTNTWTYVVKLKKTPNRFAFATLRFPYAVDTYTHKHAAQTTSITYGEDTFDAVQLLTDGAYNEYGGRSNTETQYRTGYGDNYKISGDYVTAPTRVWDTSTNSFKYFSYWSVWNVADAASKTGSQEYTRCYYPEFNLSLYQDSIITPVYNHSSYLSPSERAQADDAARTDSFSTNGRATITMMENSRMQWTAGRAGNTLSGTYINGGDRIYTDFLVSYTYQDLMLNTDTTGMKAGIVVETVRELDQNEGGYFTKTQAEYALTDNSSINKSAIKAFAEGGTNANLLKTEFSVTTLDNKNRKNQYYSLPNISQTTHEATTRKIKLYRAYSYLKNSSGTVLLVSDPIYFTIYDIASISNMQGGASYGGVS